MSQGKELNNTKGIRFKDNSSEGYELVQGHRLNKDSNTTRQKVM
jgi:hypothetical protein